MKHLSTLLVCLLPCLITSCSLKAQTPLEAKQVLEKANSTIVTPKPKNKPFFRTDGYLMDFDQIILAKRDTKLCAIKFDSIETAKLGKSNPDVSRAKVAWQRYDLVGDQYLFSKKGIDEISRGPMVGIPALHLAWLQDTVDRIYCGTDFKIHVRMPSEVLFNFSQMKNDAYNVELSPTDWSDFSEVNLSSSEIKWVKFKEQCFSTVGGPKMGRLSTQIAYHANLQNQSTGSGNESFGVLAWDANQNKYVMLDATNVNATQGSVSGNMPTLQNKQTAFFGMHTHPGSATPSSQD